MGIQKQPETIQIPVGKVTAKFRSTIYYKNGKELVRSKDYLDMGEQTTMYSLNEGVADIGAGRFIKEVDTKHFDITHGTVQIIGDNVNACSRNGVKLRTLKAGREFNVLAIHHSINGVELYQINEWEYLSSADDILFIMGHFVPLEDTFSVINNKSIQQPKGSSIPFKSIGNGTLQLLDNSILHISRLKGRFI